MARRVCFVAVLSALALLFIPRVAHAAPVVHIEWPVVAGCPSAAFVQERARAELARAREADDVRAVAEITPPSSPGQPWRLHLRTRTIRGAGERTLESPTCDGLARAGALVVALAALRTPLGEGPLEELVPAWSEAGDTPAPVSPLRLPRRSGSLAPAPQTTAGEPLHFALDVGARASFGLLPRPAIGGGALASVTWRGWSARVDVFATLPQDVTRGELGATFGALGAGLEVCRLWPFDAYLPAITMRTCVGAALDRLQATGRGGTEAFDTRRTAAMVFADLGGERVLFGPVRLGVDVRVGPSLLRPRFVLETAEDGPRELHRPSAIRADATVHLGVAF